MYQPDIAMISVDFVQKLSYRDTTEELGLAVPEVPSRMTINNRIKQMSGLLNINEIENPVTVAMADGTKAHSQEPDRKTQRHQRRSRCERRVEGPARCHSESTLGNSSRTLLAMRGHSPRMRPSSVTENLN